MTTPIQVGQDYEPAVALASLNEHPDNTAHHGDDQAVGTSIDTNGFYGALLVQRSTRNVLAGHTRRRSLLAKGATHGPVLWIDCDDDTARRILFGDNHLAELAIWDERELADKLTTMAASDPAAFRGTGFDPSWLTGLRADLDDVPPATAAPTDPNAVAAQKLETYESSAMRQIVLVLPREEYEALVLLLEQLRGAWELPSYAKVVQRLVAEHTEAEGDFEPVAADA